MPEAPAGEHDLRALADEFIAAEGYVGALLGEAAVGDRRRITAMALQKLADLRRLDLKAPVVSAYLHQHPKGKASAVRDLAGSLAKRLDSGAQVAADGVRASFTAVTADTIAEHTAAALTAVVDARGVRWSLGRWAEMNTTTIGRQATSRGVADRAGQGRTVTIDAGDCSYCQEFAGEAVVGRDPLPPFHPNCTCVASR
jgi:hypothetical protein